MKIYISTSTVILALCLLAASVSGQQASNPPFDFPAHVDVPGEKSEEARYREMVRRNNERSRRQGPAPEPRVLKKGPLAPSIQVQLTLGEKSGQTHLPKTTYDDKWRYFHGVKLVPCVKNPS